MRNKREVFPSIPDVNSATPIGEVNIADLKCGELITIKKVTTGDDFKRDRFSLVVDHHKGTFEFVSGEDLELLQLLRKLKNLNIEEHRWREERDRLRQVVTASANAQDEANDLVEKVRDERRQLVSRLGL